MIFTIVDKYHPSRRHVEREIFDVYKKEYGAVLEHFPDTLVALLDAGGAPLCAAGLRFNHEGFFSENYLDKPVDKLLNSQWSSSVNREQIAEITTLAGPRPGACLVLLRHVTEMLLSRGVTWALFTATDRLRATLRRSGVPTLDLAQAEIYRVSNPESWGRYYETNPRVAAVHESMLSILNPMQASETCVEVVARA